MFTSQTSQKPDGKNIYVEKDQSAPVHKYVALTFFYTSALEARTNELPTSHQRSNNMNTYKVLVTLFVQSICALPRHGVIYMGTTVPPDYQRHGGLCTSKKDMNSRAFLNISLLVVPVSVQCPKSHPFGFNLGQHCCSNDRKTNWTTSSTATDCDGSLIHFQSSLECCQNGDYVPCHDKICSDNSKGTFKI